MRSSVLWQWPPFYSWYTSPQYIAYVWPHNIAVLRQSWLRKRHYATRLLQSFPRYEAIGKDDEMAVKAKALYVSSFSRPSKSLSKNALTAQNVQKGAKPSNMDGSQIHDFWCYIKHSQLRRHHVLVSPTKVVDSNALIKSTLIKI